MHTYTITYREPVHQLVRTKFIEAADQVAAEIMARRLVVKPAIIIKVVETPAGQAQLSPLIRVLLIPIARWPALICITMGLAGIVVEAITGNSFLLFVATPLMLAMVLSPGLIAIVVMSQLIWEELFREAKALESSLHEADPFIDFYPEP